MNVMTRPKIVLLGMMTKMPVAGVVWQTVHYLVGFERLGYEAYYVEAHARTPSMFMHREEDDGSGRAAAFIKGVLSRFGLNGRWAYQALHDDGRCYGMSESQLAELFRSAALIVNLHGGTVPRAEHAATGRLVYLETDPVELQIELHDKVRETIEFLEPHCAFFTFGENYGRPGCRLPVSDRFRFKPTRQPVVCDFWDPPAHSPTRLSTPNSTSAFTTIGNWQQPWRRITFEGQVYHWSKHFEFLKFLNLPRHTSQSFELALSSYEPVDQHLLESQGWRVVSALDFSTDLDAYRRYIAQSRGEFTVAKDQNVRLKSGWFSDRSATYLAAGRPVITQETGFSDVLPTGRGLFGFTTLDEILAAVDAVNSDYDRHCRAAREIARDYFGHEKVLGQFLDDVGLPCRCGQRRSEATNRARRADLALTPVSRFPTVLPQATTRTVLDAPLPWPSEISVSVSASSPSASIIIVTRDNVAFNRICLESLLNEAHEPTWEAIVVDNGSTDGTLDYLRTLSRRFAQIRPIFNTDNRGFAAATNQGLRAARADVLVLLNNDTLVTPGWLEGLSRHLDDRRVALVGCLTNRCGNEAELETDYRTIAELRHFARQRQSHQGQSFDIRTATMFCLAMRRETYERLGPLDERFEVGLFEDDDYSMRARAAGYRVICANDVFIHHFGQASLGKLASSGEYGRLFHANRRRWEEKWAQAWRPYERRSNARYEQLRERLRRNVAYATPPEAVIAIVSKGDDELLRLDGRRARHFPGGCHGEYAGHYPADDERAIGELEQVRRDGAEFFVLPATSLWWLDYYGGLRRHLDQRYQPLLCDPQTCVIYDLRSSEAERRETAHVDSAGRSV